jgi:hypothetical protein
MDIVKCFVLSYFNRICMSSVKCIVLLTQDMNKQGQVPCPGNKLAVSSVCSANTGNE